MICYGSILNGLNSRSKELMNPLNQTSHPPLDTAPATDRNRWIALVVLCAGFLMIILDQTIVNVALPSIQTDLHFSQSALAWVINAYLIAFGGPAAAGRPAGRPDRAPADLPGRPDRVHLRVASLRSRRQPGAADRRAVHPGRGRGDDLRRDPGHDRDDVPEAIRAGQGDRGLQLRGRRRRRDRSARRRRSDAGDQLALDLLRESPDRDRHRRPRHAAAPERRRHRPGAGRGRARRACCSSRR